MTTRQATTAAVRACCARGARRARARRSRACAGARALSHYRIDIYVGIAVCNISFAYRYKHLWRLEGGMKVASSHRHRNLAPNCVYLLCA